MVRLKEYISTASCELLGLLPDSLRLTLHSNSRNLVFNSGSLLQPQNCDIYKGLKLKIDLSPYFKKGFSFY